MNYHDIFEISLSTIIIHTRTSDKAIMKLALDDTLHTFVLIKLYDFNRYLNKKLNFLL